MTPISALFFFVAVVFCAYIATFFYGPAGALFLQASANDHGHRNDHIDSGLQCTASKRAYSVMSASALRSVEHLYHFYNCPRTVRKLVGPSHSGFAGETDIQLARKAVPIAFVATAILLASS